MPTDISGRLLGSLPRAKKILSERAFAEHAS